MEITVHRLTEIEPGKLAALFNDPAVLRHLPLGGGRVWDEPAAAEWARLKDAQWAANGYGPWAFRIDGDFAGWGGFQKEGEDADLGLVLLPQFWGCGRRLLAEIMRRGRALPLGDVTILLPPSRVRLKGLARLGFVREGTVEYAGHTFIRFRRAA